MNTKLEYKHQLLIRQGNQHKDLPLDELNKLIKLLVDYKHKGLQQGLNQLHNNRIRFNSLIRLRIRFNKRINL